jgi:hypothetical protein
LHASLPTEGEADLMRRFAHHHRNVRAQQASVEGEFRDCPMCRAEDAVVIPAEFGSHGGDVALVHDREIAATHEVLCRHCRTSLTVVPMVAVRVG